MMEKRGFLFVGVEVHKIRKRPPPQKPSATICRTAKNPMPLSFPFSLWTSLANDHYSQSGIISTQSSRKKTHLLTYRVSYHCNQVSYI